MTMGSGEIIIVSRKHKLNIGSSRELELVSIANVLGIMMWSKYFIETQSYTIKSNMRYQDTKSTILLKKMVAYWQARPANTSRFVFFLITDKIGQGKLTVQHRGTYLMWVEVNTKPQQGNGFWLFRSVLMDIPPEYDDNGERIEIRTPCYFPTLNLNE